MAASLDNVTVARAAAGGSTMAVERRPRGVRPAPPALELRSFRCWEEEQLECRHCGAAVDQERVDLGYDYCTREECVEACLEPIDVIAVAVNKASDQYVLKRDLGWSDPAVRVRPRDEGGWLTGLRPHQEAKAAAARTTQARITELEAQLDADLAREDDPVKRAKLVNDFNARLRRWNIRYRRTAQR